ncbi:MAG: MFS transporter [Thermoplasmata archaeon]
MNENRSLKILFIDLGHFVNDGIFFLFPILVPFFAKRFDLSPLMAGSLFAIFYGFSLFLTVFTSINADIKGKLGESISLGLSLMSFSLFLYGISYIIQNNYGVILIFVSTAMMGMGASYYHPISASVLTHIVPEEKRGVHLGLNGALGSTGRAVYPILMSTIEAYFSFQISMTSLFIIGIFISFFIYRELKNVKPPVNRTAKEHLKLNFNRALLTLAIITFLRSSFSQGITAWFPTYLAYEKNIGLGILIGITMTAIYSIAIIGQPIFGILSDKMDKRILFFTSTFGTGISVILFLTTSSWLSFIFMLSYAFFNFTGYPLLMSITRDYSSENSSLSNSFIWGVANTGGMLIGSFFPSLFIKTDYSNLSYIFTVLSVSIIVVSFLIVLLPKVNRKSKMVLF